ncbi:hypothetical protein Hypma_015527 [Hypsizygus marmoreus]|uniref:Uncharacterized protein n=1 Tax=Hypsizygus marmoreus TaxID=39966 RepID=A0A369KAQ1_HYPMA|nr:hypothetical protein Hypma_015527 [Hypsizygus marmoreus]
MPPPLSIRKLLQEPFGPYPEDEILSDSLRKGIILNINSFCMYCAGSPIGFDETEYIGIPPAGSRRASNPVEFYGKLVIQSLDWLSPQAKQWLELDLRKRDNVRNSGLTLTRLYGDLKKEGSRITVWIQGELNMSARFMTDSHPECLIIYSKKISDTRQYKGRMFNVISLDSATFASSENFFTRYRLWALVDEIIRTDPDKTPLEGRTINWLLKRYMKNFRRRDRTERLICTDANLDSLTTTKRHLRHIHRSEILGVIAAHADWLLAQQLAPNHAAFQKLNIAKWISFCRQVKIARKDARRKKVHWGEPTGFTSKQDDYDLDLSRFGNTRDFWEKRIRNALKPSKSKTRQPSPSIEEPNVRNTHKPTFIYDSDFSEASTSGESDSETEESTTSFCTFPTIPAGRFEWQCDRCNYTIDFLALAEENVKDLPHHIAERLRGFSWGSKDDEDVKIALRIMTKTHFNQIHRRGVPQRDKRRARSVERHVDVKMEVTE